LIILLVPILLFLISGGIHKIEEGHLGIYWRGGRLIEGTTDPGFHLMMPFVTSYANIQISVQTDRVENIPCGTAGGVMIYFDKIEVVNRLEKDMAWETIKNYTTNYDKTWIFDKIHHEINQFCSKHTLQDVYISKFDSLDESLVLALQNDVLKWAPGIEIIGVRVTKPRIPEHIRRNYEEMEAEKTKLMIATERQKVLEREAESHKKQELIKAEADAEISKIVKQKEVLEQESKMKIEDIQNRMNFNKVKSEADSAYYKEIKEIEANEKKLTDSFLKYTWLQAISNNTKLYFGDSIPKFINTNSHESMYQGIENKK